MRGLRNAEQRDLEQMGVNSLVAIVLGTYMLALAAINLGDGVTWINEAEKSKCTNPFFSKGFSVFLDNKSYELGFREDGCVVWREPNK